MASKSEKSDAPFDGNMLTQAALVAPPDSALPDARLEFAEPVTEEVDWMAAAIQRQRADNMRNDTVKFIREWQMAGYTVTDLVNMLQELGAYDKT